MASFSSTAGDLAEATRLALRALGITETAPLLIAVSGGPDSLALLDVLLELRDRNETGPLVAAHVDHALRPSSADEAATLALFAMERKVPIIITRAETQALARERRIGLEEAAREIRYSFLQTVARDRGVDTILTGHTADDQAETVIMNIVRGAGLRGARGIPAVRHLPASGRVIRPWLLVTRQQIMQHVASRGLTPVIDESNTSLDFQRNRVRHIVIPALQEAYPDREPVRALAAFARRMEAVGTQFDETVATQLDHATGPDGTLHLAKLRTLSPELAPAVIESWLKRNGARYSLTERERHRMISFIAHEGSAGLLLRRGLRLEHDGRSLSLIQARTSAPFIEQVLKVGGAVSTPHGTITCQLTDVREAPVGPNTAIFDASQFPEDVAFTLSPWSRGDRIEPFGMTGQTKLVSDLLRESGIHRASRRFYPIVLTARAGGNGSREILWIPGVRRSATAPLEPASRAAIVFAWQPAA